MARKGAEEFSQRKFRSIARVDGDFETRSYVVRHAGAREERHECAGFDDLFTCAACEVDFARRVTSREGFGSANGYITI